MTTPHSSNVWGILPPRSYFRFDAEAIRYEREGLEAQGPCAATVDTRDDGGLMATVETQKTPIAARTGSQFLDGLRGDAREIWLNGEKITHPLDHPQLREAAETMARVYDLQHEHAAEMLAPSPDDGRLVNVTHLIPRSKDDLERRRRAIELTAALDRGHDGPDARLPERHLRLLRRPLRRVGAARQRAGRRQPGAYQKRMRDLDLSTTHSIMNPQVDRSKPEAEQAMGEVALHKVGETENHITVRGARMLATLAPYADELTIYPGSDIRPQDGNYALSFALPMGTPGLSSSAATATRSSAAASTTRSRRASTRWTRSSSSTTWRCPRRGCSCAATPSLLRGDHRHRLARPHHAPGVHPRLRQASFALGLGHLIANTTGVVRFDHIQEKLGQIWNMVELTRSALVSAEAGSALDDGGVWYPDDRPFLALRGEMPKWLPCINELLQLIGGGATCARPPRPT